MPHDLPPPYGDTPFASDRDGLQSGAPPERQIGPSFGANYGDRPTRAALFWQRQKRRLQRGGAGLVVLAVLGAGAWGVGYLLSDEEKAGLRTQLEALDPLPIKHIEIRGRELTEESDILAMLGTHTGNGLFGFSVESARKRLDTLPFVDHSTVERRLPGTVIVTLTERVPVAIWQTHGHFVLINKAGEKVSEEDISAADANVFRKMPLVVGRGANTQAADVIAILNRYPEVRKRVLALVRIGERRWNVVLRNGTQLLLPEGQEEAAAKRLTEYQDSLRLLDRPLAAIDMRLPDRMVIRLGHVAEIQPASTAPSSPTVPVTHVDTHKRDTETRTTGTESSGKRADSPSKSSASTKKSAPSKASAPSKNAASKKDVQPTERSSARHPPSTRALTQSASRPAIHAPAAHELEQAIHERSLEKTPLSRSLAPDHAPAATQEKEKSRKTVRPPPSPKPPPAALRNAPLPPPQPY